MFKLIKYVIVGPVGVLYVEEEREIGWWQAFKRLFSGGVKQGMPTAQDVVILTGVFRRPIVRYQCKVCKVFFWSWRVRPICHKWSCYKEV